MLISIPDSALYPDSRFQSDSGLSQSGADWSSSPQLSTSWQWFLAFVIIVHNTVHTL